MTPSPTDCPLDFACIPGRAARPHSASDSPRVGRRQVLAAALAAGGLMPALAGAQDGVRGEVGRPSRLTQLVSADQVEQAAQQQYGQLRREADAKRLLAPADHPQVVRLRAIAQRIIPFCAAWNPRAARWAWEVNLIRSPALNAFCMPGGKIAFFLGLLERLQLSDDEVAMVMGHEMAHALREHARERMAKTAATRIGAGLISSLFGLGNLGDAALNMGGQLLTLKFSRQDESEADLVGLDLGARAGYDPRAGISLWQKMLKAGEGAPPEFVSTHPAGPTRIADIQQTLPKVAVLYAQAPKPLQRFAPPPSPRAGNGR
jgi:Zn-dependent protease with chaperone function